MKAENAVIIIITITEEDKNMNSSPVAMVETITTEVGPKERTWEASMEAEGTPPEAAADRDMPEADKVMEETTKTVIQDLREALSTVGANDASTTRREDMVKDKESTVKNKEVMVRNKEDTVKDREVMVKAKKDMVRNKEDMVKDKEAMVKAKEGTVKAKVDTIKVREDMVQTQALRMAAVAATEEGTTITLVPCITRTITLARVAMKTCSTKRWAC